jgi:hypothetical protein
MTSKNDVSAGSEFRASSPVFENCIIRGESQGHMETSGLLKRFSRRKMESVGAEVLGEFLDPGRNKTCSLQRHRPVNRLIVLWNGNPANEYQEQDCLGN